MLSNRMASMFRKDSRYRTTKPASIVFGGGGSVLDCTMRNCSKSGAQLELSKCAHTSKQFELQLKNDKKKVDCDVVWRNGNIIGVTFLSNWKTVDPKIKSRSLSELVIENYRSQLSA